MIPRGEIYTDLAWTAGDPVLQTDEDQQRYAGLVNLGNTCYLNAQLQCAYHVPYLRQLVLDAKDEVVEVEVEVEIEDEKEGNEEGGNEDECLLPLNCGDARRSPAEAEDDIAPPPKKTIAKREIKQDIIPISDALWALQHTFNSLSAPSSSQASTKFLCRALGINPSHQKDGQEFWKLFIPQVDYSILASFYIGFFEDYVLEILSENNKMEDLVAEDHGEEKKDDCGDLLYMQKETVIRARERVQLETFLDLSIPVAEGTR